MGLKKRKWRESPLSTLGSFSLTQSLGVLLEYVKCTCAYLLLSEWSGAACDKRINRFSPWGWHTSASASGHPTDWSKEAGGGRAVEREERDREKGRFWGDASLLSFFFFLLALHFLISLPGRLWKGWTERETQSMRDKGGKAERMKVSACEWLCV